jgi:uncharacterized protein YndB with AHSA1/START domain
MAPMSSHPSSGPGIRPIDLEVELPVDAAVAWRAVTDPDRVIDWFTNASPVGPIGSVYRLEFGDDSVVSGEVVELDPGHRFVHRWHWDGADDAETTLVAWTVAPAVGGSLIRLVHSGWAEAGLDEAARDDHEGYWTGHLEDLRDLLSGA